MLSAVESLPHWPRTVRSRSFSLESAIAFALPAWRRGCKSTTAMAAEAVVLTATIILVAMCLLFGFSNGFHDAANAVATVIATKSLTPRQAVYSSALFNFLPCLVQSTAVASTIAKIVSTSCLTANAAGLDIPISAHALPLPMVAGDCPLPLRPPAAAALCQWATSSSAPLMPLQCSPLSLLRYFGTSSRGASGCPPLRRTRSSAG